LTRATLDEVRQGDWVLVVVAPWCGYSKRLVPDLPRIAQGLKQAQVAVIDGETEPSIHLQFSLDSYPFISYVHDGSIHVYNGEPEWEPILKWATNDWKNVEPLDGARNPFGWQMTVYGVTTHFFWSFYHLVIRNTPVNLTPQMAFGIIFGASTIVLLSIAICCVARLDDTIVIAVPEPATKEPSKQPTSGEQQPSKAEEKPKKEDKPKKTSVRQRKGAKRLDD